MCWKTNKLELATAKTANKPIKAFKVCRKTEDENISASYYRTCLYEVNETYGVDMEIPETNDCFLYGVHKGIHSYNPDNVIIRVTHDYSAYNIPSDLTLYYLDLIEIFSENNIRLDYFVTIKESLTRMECTIPEGATYYENEFGELVSNTITVNSIETIE